MSQKQPPDSKSSAEVMSSHRSLGDSQDVEMTSEENGVTNGATNGHSTLKHELVASEGGMSGVESGLDKGKNAPWRLSEEDLERIERRAGE